MRGRHADRLIKLERQVMPSQASIEFQRAVTRNFNRKYVSDAGLTAAILFLLAGRELPGWVTDELDRPIPIKELGSPEYKEAVMEARLALVTEEPVEEMPAMLQPILISAFKRAGLNPDVEGDWEKCLEFYSRKDCTNVR